MAKRKKRGKEKKKKTDDNDGDGDNCSEYITLLQKDKREKIQKKKGLLFYKKWLTCALKKKKSARMGRETAKRILCVCVLSLDFVLPLFNCLQFFFFQIDYVNIGMWAPTNMHHFEAAPTSAPNDVTLFTTEQHKTNL